MLSCTLFIFPIFLKYILDLVINKKVPFMKTLQFEYLNAYKLNISDIKIKCTARNLPHTHTNNKINRKSTKEYVYEFILNRQKNKKSHLLSDN